MASQDSHHIKYHFADTVAVITGGASGIGFEISRQMLDSGAFVTIWDYDSSALSMAEKELGQYGDKLSLQKVDVTDLASCRFAAEKVHKLNILVNNAGITRDKSFRKLSVEDFDSVIETNLIGAFKVTKSLYERFDYEGEHRRVINMSSVVALFGNFGQVNYAAAKSGLIGMTKTLAREFGAKGFTVNAIAPGYNQTKMLRNVPKDWIESIEGRIPCRRLGLVEDIANACLFLAARESGYINGVTLSVDGGLTL